MPNRFQPSHHDLAYNFLAAYEGEYCLVGRISHTKCSGPLQIDHADNDPRNSKPRNIHLVCQKHNLDLRRVPTKEHKAKMALYSAKNEREREKMGVCVRDNLISAAVDYTSGSPEMQVNKKAKKWFIDWTLEIISKNGLWPKKDIINSGAHVAGCNTQTSRRYLDALTGSVGPLQEIPDENGNVMIRFRRK